MSNHRTAPKLYWWRRKAIIIFAAIATLLLIIVLIFVIRTYHWDVTTTTEVTKSPQTKVTTTDKTILDWLQLLGVIAIPVVVGFGTAFFSRRQAKTSEANAENQQQEELLRTYFDKLSDLLLDKELSTNPNIQSIVRARTLAALHILNTERKAIVLRFLHDTGLLQHVKSFLYSLDLSHIDLNRIDLRGTNLRGTNLRGANLSEADLRGATLHGADLSEAYLSEAKLWRARLSGTIPKKVKLYGTNDFISYHFRGDLRGANLRGATLHGADLSEAYMVGATLKGVDLTGATLKGADLRGADLSKARLWGADLRGADLHGADLSEAYLSEAGITPRQLEEAKNVTPEQLAQIRPPIPAPQEAKTEQAPATSAQSELKPDQAEQKEHNQPKQGTDAAH